MSTERSGGSFLATYLHKPLSGPITGFLAKRKVAPNHITIFGFLLGMAGAVLLLSPSKPVILLAALLLFLQHLFDCIDGDVARLTNTKSVFGALLDEFVDRIYDTTFYLVITLIAFRQTEAIWVWPVGILAGMGHMRMISLYLKLESVSYKSAAIKSLPLWRQLLNYGSETTAFLALIGAFFGVMAYVLIALAIVSNLFTFGRFIYAAPKLEAR